MRTSFWKLQNDRDCHGFPLCKPVPLWSVNSLYIARIWFEWFFMLYFALPSSCHRPLESHRICNQTKKLYHKYAWKWDLFIHDLLFEISRIHGVIFNHLSCSLGRLNMLNLSTLNRWHLHRATIRSDMHLGGLVIYSINNPYHACMMPCPSSWVSIANDVVCVKNM